MRMKDITGGLVVILGCVAFIYIVLLITGFNWGVTHEGLVDATINCPVYEELKQGDMGTYFHKFYCSQGNCSAVEFSGDKCTTWYSYNKTY